MVHQKSLAVVGVHQDPYSLKSLFRCCQWQVYITSVTHVEYFHSVTTTEYFSSVADCCPSHKLLSMKPTERAYRLRSAIASYAGCNGTRPIAKVQLEPCSAPRGESQAAAWQDSREYLLHLLHVHWLPCVDLHMRAQCMHMVPRCLFYVYRGKGEVAKKFRPPAAIESFLANSRQCVIENFL